MSANIRHFQFSAASTFCLEFGEIAGSGSGTGPYLRFFTNGQAILDSGGDPYEIVSPYAEADLLALQFKQVNDVVRIVHPDYPPYLLSRLADDNWTLEEIEFDADHEPPMLDENITTTTITPTGTITVGGTVTLAASPDIFNALHVGSYWKISHKRNASYVKLDVTANGTSATLPVFGPWNLRTYQNWGAEVLLQQSLDGGSTWETIFKAYAESVSGVGTRSIDEAGTAAESCLMRIKVENYSNGDSNAFALLENHDAILYGIVQITAVGSGGSATATVIKELEAQAATKMWNEGAWSAYRGYPRTITAHEQRMVYGGTDYEPSKIRGSEIDNYDNFETGEDESLAYALTLAADENQTIQWMASQDALLVGTGTSEWRLLGDLQGGAISQTNFDAKQISYIGSAYLQAVVAEKAVLFLDRKGQGVQEIRYNSEFGRLDTNDLMLFARDKTEAGTIVQMAWQPDLRILWCVTSDGRLLGLTYQRDQAVIGWHSHDTASGLFRSVACIYGDVGAEDEVWVIVERTIGSAQVFYVERLYPVPMAEIEDGVFLDSCLIYDGSPLNSFAGADHLIGETVVVLADGVIFEGIEIESDGGFSLPTGVTASYVIVGLAYEHILSPFRLDADSGAGVNIGKVRRLTGLSVRLLSSAIPDFSQNGTTREQTIPEALRGSDPDNPPLVGHALNDGRRTPVDVPLDFRPDLEHDNIIALRSSKPLPCTVLALAADYTVST